jgi:hypothetical protein
VNTNPFFVTNLVVEFQICSAKPFESKRMFQEPNKKRQFVRFTVNESSNVCGYVSSCSVTAEVLSYQDDLRTCVQQAVGSRFAEIRHGSIGSTYRFYLIAIYSGLRYWIALAYGADLARRKLY